MTRTVLESKTKTVIIGFDQPFCVIGERINPTGRKKLAAELEQDDYSTVEADALAQVAAGATVLDINSGAVFSNKMAEDPRYADNNFVEPPLMRELVSRVQALVDVPLCIDSSVPGALKNGLEAAEGRPLLNSVTGEEERLELVLPLVKKYNVPVVAISNDDTGISEDPDVRFAVAKKIVERAADHGIRQKTSWSIRWSCRSARWGRRGCRCSRWCDGCARSLASTPPAARRISASVCRTVMASTMRFWRWLRGGDDVGDHEPGPASGADCEDRGEEGGAGRGGYHCPR